jgi:hypothetical protein
MTSLNFLALPIVIPNVLRNLLFQTTPEENL